MVLLSLCHRANVLPDHLICLALLIHRVITPPHCPPPLLSSHLCRALSHPCGGELCDISLRVALHRPPATAAAAAVQA